MGTNCQLVPLHRPLPAGCIVKSVQLSGEQIVYLTGWLLKHNPLPRVLGYHSYAYDAVTYSTRRLFLQSFGRSISLATYPEEYDVALGSSRYAVLVIPRRCEEC